MPQATVAIVGRPNVGKSTLFNRLVGKRVALVDDRPGVTRDRREGEGELLGLQFRVMDTAGFEDEDPKSLPGRMRAQTEAAVREADVALFMIDAREGLTGLDEEIGRWLRSEDTPVIVAANKAEGRGGEAGRLEAYKLGWAIRSPSRPSMARGWSTCSRRFARTSSARNSKKTAGCRTRGRAAQAGDRRAAQCRQVDPGQQDAGRGSDDHRARSRDHARFASASSGCGTTRAKEARPVRLIDTAGLRKRAKVEDKLEKLSVMDTKRAIDFAEVVVLLLDATRGLEVQDLKIAEPGDRRGPRAGDRAQQVGRGGKCLEPVQRGQGGARGGLEPAQGRPGADHLGLYRQGHRPIDRRGVRGARTMVAADRHGRTQSLVRTAVEANPPPAPGGKRIKLRYITQVKTRPPSFVIFGSRVDQLPRSYERYLLNSMRRDLGLGPVPVRLAMRAQKNPYADNAQR